RTQQGMIQKTMRTTILLLLIGLTQGWAQPEMRKISGHISLQVSVERSLHSLSPYARTRYAKPSAPKLKPNEITEVVLFIPNQPAFHTTPMVPDTFVIEQRNMQLIPHMLVIPVGSVVSFPNRDDVFHNIFSLSPTKRFDLGRFPEGESRQVMFDKPGVVKIFCDIHAEMNAIVYVTDTPVYTRPDGAGNFEVSGIPPGKYDLHIWHDLIDQTSVPVDLTQDDVTNLTLNLGD
ncbi:MAG: hypothetical protein K9N22_07375, partial [Candidatus Marinimicrobia bacterium]|nr:hypothetical protein [Candidatus Neomarinimicrobiota bacterium]